MFSLSEFSPQDSNSRDPRSDINQLPVTIISSLQLEKDQGIEECLKGSKRRVNYGYGELLSAGVYESDGFTAVKMGTKVKDMFMVRILI